jgi:hypothetical protein
MISKSPKTRRILIMATLEQVEKLCTMANISYEEAKAALDASNGDLLEAIIYLERQGKVHAPTGGGYYSSEKIKDAEITSYHKNNWEKHQQHQQQHKDNPFFTFIKGAWDFCKTIVHKGNINSFEVLKGNEIKATIPVTILILMLIFAFWVTIPLTVIGVFFGLRYRFVGPDLKDTGINDAMNNAADAAENLKNSINNN